MIRNIDSLWVRILKARYFPNSSLFEAFKSSRAFWKWSSLVIGLEVLEKGYCWKNGDGKLVRIWEDKWILKLHGHELATDPLSFDNIIGCVLNIIDLAQKRWNLEIIEQWLYLLEKNAILNIHIPELAKHDELVQCHLAYGEYSIKYYYHFLTSIQVSTSGVIFSCYSPLLTSLWSQI